MAPALCRAVFAIFLSCSGRSCAPFLLIHMMTLFLLTQRRGPEGWSAASDSSRTPGNSKEH